MSSTSYASNLIVFRSKIVAEFFGIILCIAALWVLYAIGALYGAAYPLHVFAAITLMSAIGLVTAGASFLPENASSEPYTWMNFCGGIWGKFKEIFHNILGLTIALGVLFAGISLMLHLLPAGIMYMAS